MTGISIVIRFLYTAITLHFSPDHNLLQIVFARWQAQATLSRRLVAKLNLDLTKCLTLKISLQKMQSMCTSCSFLILNLTLSG